MADLLFKMEKVQVKSKAAENTLFAFLGAMTALVLSLGVFGAVDNRAPASIEPTVQETDFDARV